ncbi:MAG: VWA domain-containing protein, partial [Thermoanaerobaculia bacterium]
MNRQPSETIHLASSRSHLVSAVPILCGLLLTGWATIPVAAEESAWNMVYDVTEVNVVNVEVVVTDSQGQLVTGLTRDDFELLENGKPVTISNFYAMENGVTSSMPAGDPAAAEIAAAEAAPIIRPIHLVIYVDTANIAKLNRAKVLARIREFLLDHWRQGMRVMLVSNDGPAAGSAVIRQGFTSVPHDLFVGLEEIAGQALVGPRLDQDRRTLRRDLNSIKTNTARGLSTVGDGRRSYEEAVYAEVQVISQRIAIYSEQALVNVRRTLGTLSHFVDTMAGMPGRKSILYVSDGLDVTPGADLFEALSAYQATTSLGPSFTSTAGTDRRNATRDVEELVARANAHRVTLNILDASPGSRSVGSAAEIDGIGGTSTGTWGDSLSSIGQRNRVEALM